MILWFHGAFTGFIPNPRIFIPFFLPNAYKYLVLPNASGTNFAFMLALSFCIFMSVMPLAL